MEVANSAPRGVLLKAVASMLVILMSVTIGVVGATTRAEASHGGCVGDACNGKWPVPEGCTAGDVTLKSNFFYDWQPYGPRASINLNRYHHCSTWARFQWDGPPYPVYLVLRVKFWVERWEYRWNSSLGSWAWDKTHTQTRWVSEAHGGYYTRMVPKKLGADNGDVRYRACAQISTKTDPNENYGPYGPAHCTGFHVGAAGYG